MPNVPQWAIQLIKDVATIGADVAEIKTKAHSHRNGSLNGIINKKWLSLGIGIGVGLLGIGTGIVTLLGG